MRTTTFRTVAIVGSKVLVIGALLAWGVSQANAAIMVDLRTVGVSGPGLTIVNPHFVTLEQSINASSTITMDVVVRVTGADVSLINEKFQLINGGFHNVLSGTGLVTGDLAATRWIGGGSSPYDATSFATGVAVNPDGVQIAALNGQGGLDIFDGTSTSQNNAFQARAMALTSTSGAPEEFKIGSLTFSNMDLITGGGYDFSTLIFTRRNAAGAGLWAEDNIVKSFNTPGIIFNTEGVRLAAVPEPLNLVLVGMAGLALAGLARRRVAKR